MVKESQVIFQWWSCYNRGMQFVKRFCQSMADCFHTTLLFYIHCPIPTPANQWRRRNK